MIQLAQGLYMFSIFLFCSYCVYFVLIGKKTPNMDLIGKVVYHTGELVIGILLLSVIFALAIMGACFFANMIDIPLSLNMFGR